MIQVIGEPIERKPVTEKLSPVTKMKAVSRKVGRPRKPNALSAAERQRRHRLMLKAQRP